MTNFFRDKGKGEGGKMKISFPLFPLTFPPIPMADDQ
ncbi:hypothetical protein Ple7327_1476 [Pleurocapsa sp. PCC 7327]|nr:hypothetical protein Ple7327_1476 [Pleurocapsa sp. PCC 7327]